MKKLGVLLCILAMVFSLLIPVSAAGDSAVVTIGTEKSVSDVSVGMGEKFDLYINIKDSEAARGLNINGFTYDDEYITVDSMEWLLTGSVMSEIGDDPVIAFTSAVDINKSVMVLHCTAKKPTTGTPAELTCTVTIQYPQEGTPLTDTVVLGNMNIAKITVADNRPEIEGLSMKNKTVAYNGEAQSITVTGTIPGDATPLYTIKKDGVPVEKAIDAGTYTVEASVTGAAYKDWTGSATLTITPKEVSLDIPAVADKVYDGKTASNEIKDALDDATVDSDDVVTGDTVNATFPNDWTVSDTGAGKHSVTISNITLDNANYVLEEASKEVTLQYTITPKELVVEINDAVQVIGSNQPPRISFGVSKETGKGFVDSDIVDGTPRYKLAGEAQVQGDKIVNKDIRLEPATDNYELTFVEGKLIEVDKPTRVQIEGNLEKTVYYENDRIDPEGLTVTLIVDQNGTEVEIPVSADLLDAEDAPDVDADNTACKVKFSFAGVECEREFEITVNVDDIDTKTIQIQVQTEDNRGWVWVGETPTVTVTAAAYESGKVGDAITVVQEDLVVEVDTAAEAGDVTVKVSYKDYTNSENKISVIKNNLVALEIEPKVENAFNKIEGQIFTLTLDNTLVNAVYKDKAGNRSEDDVTSEFAGLEITSDKQGSVIKTLMYTKTVGESYNVTVTGDLTIAFAKKTVTDIALVKAADKVTYFDGETFIPAGAEVRLYYDNEKDELITANYGEYGISFNPASLKLDNPGEVNPAVGKEMDVSVVCGTHVADDKITVTVIPVVLESIKVEKAELEYVDGQSFDKENDISVTAIYNNKKEVKSFKDFTVDVPATFTLENPKVKDEVTVTVSADGVSDVTYTVIVVPCVAKNADTGELYGDLQDAIDEVKDNETLEIPLPSFLTGTYYNNNRRTFSVKVPEVLVDGEPEEVSIPMVTPPASGSGSDTEETLNLTIGEEVTVEPPQEDARGKYYFFYMQMLEWRNRIFDISIKQSEGGSVSGPAGVRNGETAEITITPDEGYAIADVLVNGKSVGAVESYKIRNVKANTTVSAVFEKLAPVSPFVDVAVDAPYFDAVLYVYKNGIINGVSETEMVFAPNTTMTRAMFVTVLGRMAGVNTADYASVSFADCEAGSWYAPFVEWAANAGIVTGYSAESFGPMDEITVEQAAVILYRFAAYMGYNTAAGADLANYADGAQVAEWAAEQMKWAVANNIYVSDTTLDPKAPAVRSLVAEMLYNLSVWMG